MKSISTRATRIGRLLAFALLLAASLISAAYAQEARGTITGKVLDTNKAIVPGAQVKIINEAQGTTVALQATDAGLFRAPYLISGTYRMWSKRADSRNMFKPGWCCASVKSLKPKCSLKSAL